MNRTNLYNWITFSLTENQDSFVCFVEFFSDELKVEIRNMLSSIFHWIVTYDDDRNFYSYSNTVKDFLWRYNSKSDNIKKWMIWELLAHLFIPKIISKFETLSVYKNKEESSIKKWFDIMFYDNVDDNLWYWEVKSWWDKSDDSSNNYNKILLERAKNQVNDSIWSDRIPLWDSVLTDVNSTILNSNKKINIKQLLKSDAPWTNERFKKRNVILTSVLYKKMDDKIDINLLSDYTTNTLNTEAFEWLITFSIQKETYSKIELFLNEEINND